jgi:cvfA/B/C family virulence factor
VTRYRVLSWRGIPLQLKVFEGEQRPISRQLPAWFMEHIDRVAMRDGLAGSDLYLEQLEWSEFVEREGSREEVADAVLEELEVEWAPVRRHWEETGELE